MTQLGDKMTANRGRESEDDRRAYTPIQKYILVLKWITIEEICRDTGVKEAGRFYIY